MKFSISGADKDTGETIEMTVEAPDETAAQEVAHRKGIMVSRVSAITVRTAPPSAASVAHPLEQGHYRGAPVINVAMPRRSNSLGISSLVLGVIAFLICWIPLVNLLGVPLSALGLLLGLIGLLVALTRKGASIGYPIAGSAVCGLALFIAISMTGAFMNGLKKASETMVADANRRNATNQSTVKGPADKSDPSPASPPANPAASHPVPEKPSEPAIEWASAETPVRQGDVQVKVTSATVGLVPLTDGFRDSTATSKDSLLSIQLEITNLGDTKKVEYRSWGRSSSFRSRASLTDNFDNRYKSVNFGFTSKAKGSIDSESVYPGKTVSDVLVFEEPIQKAEYLNLELSAEEFGGNGMIRVRIPASMIKR